MAGRLHPVAVSIGMNPRGDTMPNYISTIRARGGRIAKGRPVIWILGISIALTVLGFLITAALVA